MCLLNIGCAWVMARRCGSAPSGPPIFSRMARSLPLHHLRHHRPQKADHALLAYQDNCARWPPARPWKRNENGTAGYGPARWDGQNLALCRIKLETLEAGLAHTALATQLTEIIGTLKCIIADTRFLTFELSPPALYEIGLPAALNTLTQNIQSRSGIKCVFKDEGLAVQIGHDLRTILYQAAANYWLTRPNMRKRARSRWP